MTDGPWIINVNGRAYGPYDEEQMRSFAREGRVVGASLVARAGETEFRTAAEEPQLAHLFASAAPSSIAEALQNREPRNQPPFGKYEDDERDGLAHVLVMADMRSRSISGLEEEIYRLGVTVPLLPQVWLLSTDLSANTVRNILIQQLGKVDVLLVVDATRDKAAWFNFGPEIDAKIRRLWLKRITEAA